jgi:hypothetical protein
VVAFNLLELVAGLWHSGVRVKVDLYGPLGLDRPEGQFGRAHQHYIITVRNGRSRPACSSSIVTSPGRRLVEHLLEKAEIAEVCGSDAPGHEGHHARRRVFATSASLSRPGLGRYLITQTSLERSHGR